MKIFILIAGVYYEDAHTVLGAYTSNEKAEIAKEKAEAEKEKYNNDYFEIVEIKLQ